MQAIQIQAIKDMIHWITLNIPCFDFAYLVSKQTLLFCALDLAVVAFVYLVDGAGGGIRTGIDCVAGY